MKNIQKEEGIFSLKRLHTNEFLLKEKIFKGLKWVLGEIFWGWLYSTEYSGSLNICLLHQQKIAWKSVLQQMVVVSTLIRE